MRAITKNQTIVGVVFVLLLVLSLPWWINHFRARRDTEVRRFFSPDGRSAITVTERREVKPQTRENVVTITESYDGKETVANLPFWSDSPNVRFFTKYADHAWIDNSILRFINASSEGATRSELTVTNESLKPILFLRINAGDLFLILKMEGKSTLKFAVGSSIQSGDLSYIGCIGQFQDREIPEAGQNFLVTQPPVAIAHYNIRISDSGVSIGSPDYEKTSFPPRN